MGDVAWDGYPYAPKLELGGRPPCAWCPRENRHLVGRSYSGRRPVLALASGTTLVPTDMEG